MRRLLTSLALTAATVTMALVLATPSHAALITCPANFTQDGTAKVNDGSVLQLTAADGCQYDNTTTNSTVANITNINSSGFFGFSDWESNGQDQLGGSGNTGQSGTWDILNVDFDTYDYIIVFKDGEGTYLTAFSFNELFDEGEWLTPFTNPPFAVSGDGHDVSHLTIARRLNEDGGPGPGPGQVPEPGTLAVVGAGLAGWWALSRRRKTKV